MILRWRAVYWKIFSLDIGELQDVLRFDRSQWGRIEHLRTAEFAGGLQSKQPEGMVDG